VREIQRVTQALRQQALASVVQMQGLPSGSAMAPFPQPATIFRPFFCDFAIFQSDSERPPLSDLSCALSLRI
jgi:hypothetical protein